MQKAMSLAEAHGYKNVSLTRVDGKGHERLADEVLAYFFVTAITVMPFAVNDCLTQRKTLG